MTENEANAAESNLIVPTTQVVVDGVTVDGNLSPQDRTFRNAWELVKGVIRVDMERAREIQKEMLRAERKPLLEALDVQYQRADERGDTAGKQQVAAQKQRLRDVTADARIDAAKTPDELKALTMEALTIE